MTIIYIILSTIIVSLISLVGIFTIAVRDNLLKKMTVFMVSLSAGTLLGDSLLHLMPEAIEKNDGSFYVWLWLLGGIIIFFVLEKVISWRHCHESDCENHIHRMGPMNLLGDCVHNFIDGLIIAVSFLASAPLGVATTLAIIIHEIPQEIGDFGILIHSGYTKTKALYMNFLTAMLSILGAVVGIIAGGRSENFIGYITPLAAGGFIYIATADIIPELHKENGVSKSLKQLSCIIIGIGIMLALKIYSK